MSLARLACKLVQNRQIVDSGDGTGIVQIGVEQQPTVGDPSSESEGQGRQVREIYGSSHSWHRLQIGNRRRFMHDKHRNQNSSHTKGE